MKSVPFTDKFEKLFDNEDMLSMYNIPDESACLLKAHLILEDLITLYCSKLSDVEDLFSGVFVPFKTKLVISRNMGLHIDAYKILDKVNDIRNKFSHRKRHKLEDSQVEGLRVQVNSFLADANITPCEEFKLSVKGKDQHGTPSEKVHDWTSSEPRLKFIILFINLMVRLVWWIQNEFKGKNIDYAMLPIKFT
ncbi:hypothetical protein F0261_19495 [Alteromonas sp. 07-89-2]|uniref:hypothetical protein n=1 Tax=Alteromonas sp. 07-89-2 TaxID=2607609 RepID=UPI00148DAE5E|nr:hypothetical protein [Alteromonas sp. 07-89-2]NOH60212.1 hypothetical protein [Alteromonas sp. 07-89-2]